MKKQQKKANKAATRRPARSKPTRTVYSVLRQLVNHIPCGLIDSLARRCGVVSRDFTPTSHVVALVYGQISGCGSLNSICDAARLHAGEWNSIRRAEPPHRNTLSNANRRRPAELAEALYWAVFDHLVTVCPGFGGYRRHMGFLCRLKREIFAVDSSTIKLVLNCIDWAKHRRKKAAAKLHMCLDVGPRLPSFAIVESAAHHDSVRAEAVTANLKADDICLADRAYTDFGFLDALNRRGAFFVVRQKRNMLMRVLERKEPDAPDKATTARSVILSDERVVPAKAATAAKYGGALRRVTADVEVDGKTTRMMFLTNNLDWSPRTIAELYRARWAVELFFKELKQTCQIHDFVGYNENAVKWQVWIGLLVLDRYEGCPRIYRRLWLEVICRGERYPAMTYEMTLATKTQRQGKPYPEEYRLLCSEGAEPHHIPNAFTNERKHT